MAGSAGAAAGGTAPRTSAEDRNLITRIAIALIAALIIIGAVVVNFATKPNQGLGDVAAIIGIVTLAAVTIERAIETFWGLIGSWKNAWWPLSAIYSQIETLQTNANALVAPVFAQATQQLTAAKELTRDEKAQKEIQDAIDWVSTRSNQLQVQREQILDLTRDKQQLQLLTNAAFQAVNEVNAMTQRWGPALKDTVQVANQALVGATDFAATFQDNPARRTVSLAIGAALGMVVAGAVGLDIFAAINGTAVAGPYWGVLTTGIVMGLGANPTHEVIRVLQEAKKKRELENGPAPSLGDTGTQILINLPEILGGTRAGTTGGNARFIADPDRPERILEQVDAVDVRALLEEANIDLRAIDDANTQVYVMRDRPQRAATAVYSPAPQPTRGLATFTLRRR